MTVGQDSFQDVVSNIVGILIILVLVTGIRMGRLPVGKADNRVDEPRLEELQAAKEEFLKSKRTYSEIDEERETIMKDVRDIDALLLLRTVEKNGMIGLLGEAEAAVREESQKLSENDRTEFELKRRMIETDQKLAEASRTEEWLENGSKETSVIYNIPTPLADRVSEEREAHFRLKGGKISHVPFGILIEKMMSSVRGREKYFRTNNVLVDKVGPVDDFQLEFRIVAKLMQSNIYGEAHGKSVELDYCEFQPIRSDIGELLEDALKPGSKFLEDIVLYPEGLYTVTIWVYPDSFAEFRKIREFLFKKGYLCAARPLPNGSPIAASPEGTSSTAQ